MSSPNPRLGSKYKPLKVSNNSKLPRMGTPNQKVPTTKITMTLAIDTKT